MHDLELPNPAIYRPWMKGVYDVSPSLKPFGFDFGNGAQDRLLFQLDAEWPKYRESKCNSLRENSTKYIARQEFSAEAEDYVKSFVIERLLTDSPRHVSIAPLDQLHICDTTVDSSLDDVIAAVQEDIAVVTKIENRDWISYVSVCNPSHWLPTEKVGLSFFDAHTPIPGFERVNAAAPAIVDSMISRGPFVRFVWGLESDDRLNHHPIAPAGIDQTTWYGREFEKGLFLRVERQVLWPLPKISSALFTIRPYVYPIEVAKESSESWNALVSAYRSMSLDARLYKGLPENLL